MLHVMLPEVDVEVVDTVLLPEVDTHGFNSTETRHKGLTPADHALKCFGLVTTKTKRLFQSNFV
jgi:hypothetical protein